MNRDDDRKEPGAALLRELRSPQNLRFLRGLPPFRVEDGLPEPIETLLRRLEAAERGVAGAARDDPRLHGPAD